MASLKKNGSNYGLVWTDSSREPSQVRESLKTDIRRRAIAKQKELEWKYHEGEHDPWKQKWYEKPTDHSIITIESAVESFIRFKTGTRGQQGWNDTTQKREVPLMRKFARYVGNIPLDNLTKGHLEDFYFRDKVNSPHTRASDYISVNTFLNWCVTNEYIDEKPIFKPKKPQSKVPKYIHPKELAKLIHGKVHFIEDRINNGTIHNEKQAGYWVVLGWMILAGTGMRPIELSQIRISDIYGDNILVGAHFDTKTKEERYVPLMYEAKQAVQLLTNPHYRQLDPTMKDSDLLLGRKPNYCKTKLSRDFTNIWKLVFPNKPKRTLYNLKDMFCVRFLHGERDTNIDQLASILGHSSYDTTKRYQKSVPHDIEISGTIWDYPVVSQ